MSLSIYNNVYSLNAQKALTLANNAQAKSIERLSTGLRINHAADDASGLAISEKLRGQISGLKRAAMNAQDGISYLQTAEGGMEEVTNMLQRMREIAVQAGNGTYTTNDRSMLQLEVDQLKEEVNRISRTTEFNTKKLLNGDGTALWSADKEFLGAIVRGPAVAEGNYKIETNMTPGTNSKYKSNIMSVNKGVLVAEVTANVGTNMNSVRDPYNIPTTGTAQLTVAVGSDTAAITASAKITSTFKQTGSNWTAHNVSAGMTATYAGYFEVEYTNGGVLTATGTTAELTFRYRVMDAKTGKLTEWRAGAANVAGASATLTLDVRPDGAGAAQDVIIRMPYGGDFKSGDKLLGNFAPALTAAAAVTAAVTVSGGGTITVANGPRVDYAKKGELTKADNGDVKTDYNKVTVHVGNMDTKTGVIDWGSLTMEFQEGVQNAAGTPGVGATVIGSSTVAIRDSGAATKDTKLSDIASFTNDDGRSILENTQELKIYGNGKNTSIFLEADDTVEDFITKLTAALVGNLDMGTADNNVMGQTVNNNLVKYIPNLHNTENTSEAAPGTFVVQSAKLGDDSDLVFVGDQGLIDALGLATLQEGQNSSMDVKVTDAHSGKYIGGDTVGDGRLRNVIGGVEVTLEQNLGVDAVWNASSKTIEYAANAQQGSGYLHVVDNRTELQIGANQGQTINISVGQLDTTGLEIDDVYVMDMDLSQTAITKIDKAIESLNASRATIGAQINRLEYTINNLETARENLTASEDRIRGLDMAEATADFSKNQVLVQAATAMVAQANQVPQQALTLLKG